MQSCHATLPDATPAPEIVLEPGTPGLAEADRTIAEINGDPADEHDDDQDAHWTRADEDYHIEQHFARNAILASMFAREGH